MAGTAQQPAQHSDLAHPRNRRGKQAHHGRTVAAWVGSSIALVAFIVGAIALVMRPQNWIMFGVAAGLAVVAIIVTVVLQRMGYGAH